MKKNETDNYKNFAAVVNANKESDLQVIARLEQENAELKAQIEKNEMLW